MADVQNWLSAVCKAQRVIYFVLIFAYANYSVMELLLETRDALLLNIIWKLNPMQFSENMIDLEKCTAFETRQSSKEELINFID